MKVMTFNVWNYQSRWEQRRQLIADLISVHRPDAVALQETRHDFRFARGMGQGEQLAELTGYVPTSVVAQVYIPVLRVDEGLTILTRAAPIDVMVCRLTQHPADRDDENHRVCLGVVVGDAREYCIFNSHFSLSPAARETNALEVARFVRDKARGRPAVVMGDLNAEPHTPPIRFLTGQEELRGMEAEFLDCWTAAHPGEKGFTYASWEPVRRIDYVLGLDIHPDTVRAEIVGADGKKGVHASDHMGIVVDFDPA